MVKKQRPRNRPDMRIDVTEARRRGREEIRRLRAMQETSAAKPTLTVSVPLKEDSVSQESHAMKAPTSAWLE